MPCHYGNRVPCRLPPACWHGPRHVPGPEASCTSIPMAHATSTVIFGSCLTTTIVVFANRRVLIWSGPLFIRVFCIFLPVEPSQSIILLIDVVSAVLLLNRIRCVRRPNYLAKERPISSYMPFSTICSRHSKDMSIPNFLQAAVTVR
ncbi:hypothetical protein C8Q69DRAFT_103257 [Paecilomyces variotii]|uniref:Uncharacterized protein n=1 Tax=Byssochlamys spectabilis TaxID=264951 RepID=A0A443HJT4_BYSSP|nr:hypothetical protein C8Q69DRAFT_103257 [Paecilomyces variotii]RWQ92103.1 hypothetical protein C8Q69DRAFT_103257 [Paecilomyces variotii]